MTKSRVVELVRISLHDILMAQPNGNPVRSILLYLELHRNRLGPFLTDTRLHKSKMIVIALDRFYTVFTGKLHPCMFHCLAESEFALTVEDARVCCQFLEHL